MCYDEATEGLVVFVGGDVGVAIRCAEKVGIGTREIGVGGFLIGSIAVLPISKAVGIGHLGFGLLGKLTKRSVQFALARRYGLRVTVQGIITDDRAAVTISGIEGAVACEAATHLFQNDI